MGDEQIVTAADFVQVLAATGRPVDGGIRVAPERELVSLTKLSRPRIREYLAGLQTVGLLKRVQGSGTLLRVPGADDEANVFTLMERSGQLPLDDIDEFREMLEIGVLPQLAGTLQEARVAELRLRIEEMHAASRAGDAEAGCEADLAFHRAVLRCAGNRLLDFIIDSLDGTLRAHILDRRVRALAAEAEANGGERPASFRTDAVHEEILEALISGDDVATARAVRLHFSVHRGLLS
ncbi:FadR/GntR family transcriptional regulator [Brevibacterium album]|uniref:FadR/GntR family transcriptional regulator n=1 Tax=Brevibacterium album TaxID=417948 RepID=UPI00040ACFC7|nr:FCD domain-containing protein [Brevibacterium album]